MANNRIKALRAKHGLTLMQLSKEVGIRDNTIRQYETDSDFQDSDELLDYLECLEYVEYFFDSLTDRYDFFDIEDMSKESDNQGCITELRN